MRYILLFLISTFVLSAEEIKEKKEEKIFFPFKENGLFQSFMMIDAKSRATDFLKAYDLLKREKASARVFFKLTNGTTLTNIVDVSLLEGNSLFFFKISSLQGIKYTIVPVEEIAEIGNL